MLNPHKKVVYYTWRFRLILLILFAIFLLLVARMLDLTVFNRAFLQKESDARVLRTVEAPAYRGMILDRQGNPLAISTPVKAVWINPQGFEPSQIQMSQLAKLLNTTPKNIRQQAEKIDREFVYLQRG